MNQPLLIVTNAITDHEIARVAMQHAIHVEHRHDFEDEVVPQLDRPRVLGAEKFNAAAHHE